MATNQNAFGRRARSVCIVTKLPVRLQAKSTNVLRDVVESRIVRLGSITIRIGVSPTGEVVCEIEPP